MRNLNEDVVLVVLEGTDGSGKSTQCSELKKRLENGGYVVATPVSNKSRAIRRVYKELIDSQDTFPNPMSSLFLGLADYLYAFEKAADIENDVILMDRYYYSAFADLLANMPQFDYLPIINEVEKYFTEPDIKIFLKVDPEIALSRKNGCTLAESGGPIFAADYNSLEASFLSYQNMLIDVYPKLMASKNSQNYHEIMADDHLESVADLIETLVNNKINKKLSNTVTESINV